MVGQPKLRKRQSDRWNSPLSVCFWVNPVPLLLLGLICSPVIVSSTGLATPVPDSERPKYRTAYACEGSTLNMDCDQGHVINLIRANYGRFSITICNEHGNTEWSVNCMSLRSHRVLHDRCSQRQNCSVPASTRGFGDPCPGTLKYLEAHFQCVPVNPPSHTARPRPPWFLPTKTTMSSLTEEGDHDDPHRDTPFLPRDPSNGKFPQELPPHNEGVQEGFKEDKTRFKALSTTTTIRPPPWLITNTTKNTTTVATTAPVAPTTVNLKSTTTVSSTSTTPPQPPIAEGEEPDPSNPKVSSTTTRPPVGGVEEVDGGANPKDNSRGEETSDEGIVGGAESPHSGVEEQRRRVYSSSTVSTTTVWESKIDVPYKGGLQEEETNWCPPSSGRGLFWNWTRSSEVATQPCPGGASGQATRQCSPEGWVSPPDLGMCRSVWLTTLLTRSEDKDSVLAIAQDLTQVTESRKLYGGDITAAARLVSELTERMGDDVSSFPDRAQLEALVTELVVKALTTVSNLFGRQRLAWGDLRVSEHSYAITKLLLGLEEAAFFLADNIHHEKTVTHAVPNILMRLQVLETRNVAPVTFPSPDDPWPGLEPPSTPTYSNSPYSEEGEMFALSPSSVPSSEAPSPSSSPQRHLQDFITLPPEALLENSENGLVKMVFFSYEGLHKLLLQPERGSYGYGHGGYGQPQNRTRILNSRVVSASLGAGRHIELSEPVYITFAMIRTVNVTNPACVFWDYTTSLWSEEGCRVLRFNRTHTTCQCDHLTNFAVLMDVHATPMSSTHQVALSVITYVGCVISIVCLLLATIVFHAFRGLKNDRTTIHKNLCICLMLGEALFVGGISRTDQPLVCGVVAGFLHYLFLAAFAWMFLEGFQLYIMLSEVFEAEKSRVKWYYATAYGFPALVVAVSAVIDPYSYGTETVCWLRTDNYFIFAFVGPVLLVLLANSVFLTLSLILMCRHAQNSAVLKNKETTRLTSLRSWIRGAVILMFLLGLTWTFGLLYLDQASVAMAYVFTILNSLQGLFIFVFHCLQNDKVKKEMRRACRRHSWLRACLCYSRSHSTPTSTKTDARNSQLAPTLGGTSQATNSLVSGLSTGRWRRRSSAGSNGTAGPQMLGGAALREGTLNAGTIGSLGVRGSLVRAQHQQHYTNSLRSNRHALPSSMRHALPPSLDHEEEKYSFKSCGRDSGHGGSEQEESPRTGPPVKISSLRLNNNVAQMNDHPQLVNPFAAAAALEHSPPNPASLLPDYRLASDASNIRQYPAPGYPPGSLPGMRIAHRNQSPWNHTYTEIPDGLMICPMENAGPDPVYEEIEREGRSEIQVSDLSDEDGRRQNSDISRQSSRSYGDHRPLLPYTLPDHSCAQTALTSNDPRFQQRFRHPDAIQLSYADNHTLPAGSRVHPSTPLDHTIVSGGHLIPIPHPSVCSNNHHAIHHGNGHVGSPLDSQQYKEAVLHALGHGTVVQPLSEPNLRSWEAVQRHRDLQQLQHLGEMTVAVLNGEQVVCKLKSPLAPIHENSSSQAPTTTATATATLGVSGGPGTSERFMPPQTYSHC